MNENSSESLVKRRRRSKWDVPASEMESSSLAGRSGRWDQKQDTPLTQDAAEMAKERATRLSAKLAASGKLVSCPAILPHAQNQSLQNMSGMKPAMPNGLSKASEILATQIHQLENGYSAEVEINDLPFRDHIMSPSAISQICKQSGASIIVKGTVMSDQDKATAISKGYRPLYLAIESPIQAKVQVALHKLYDISQGQSTPMKTGPDSGLPSGMQYVQDKVFVGIENADRSFNLKERLEGPNCSFLHHISSTTGAKVHLRGKGSAFAEPTSGRESYEALHIYINHPHPDGLSAARVLCESLIQKVQYDFRMFSSSYPAQAPPSYHGNMLPPQRFPAQGQPPYFNMPPSSSHMQHQMNQNYNSRMPQRPFLPPPHSSNGAPPDFQQQQRPMAPPQVSYPCQVTYPGQMSGPPVGVVEEALDHGDANFHKDTSPPHIKESLPINSVPVTESQSPPRRKRRFTEDPSLIKSPVTSAKERQEVTSPRLDSGPAAFTEDVSGAALPAKPIVKSKATRKASEGEPFKTPIMPPAIPSQGKITSMKKPASTKGRGFSTRKPPGALASLLGYGDEDDDSDSD